MNYRFVAALAGAAFLVAACGGDANTAETTAGEAPERMAMADIVGLAEETTANNEPLDDICRRLYADAEADTDLKVGLVAGAANIDDGTFSQAAFEGMEAAGRCFGLETSFLESAGDDSAGQLDTMLTKDVDIVITVGFPFQDVTLDAAADRPDLRFIGVDQGNPDDLDNYVAIAFRDDQVGFIAGAMAGLLTEGGIVAVVAGPDTVPPVVAIADGFEAGVAHTNPEATVLRRHLDSFVDPESGAATAQANVGNGADVVFGAAGDTGTAATRVAATSGAWAIGVDQDEYFTTFAGGAEPGANRLATSAIKRVDLGVFLTLAAYSIGEVEGGGLLLGAENGGVGYAPFHQADIGDDVAVALEDIRLGLASGDIEPLAGD
ncbi:MAG: BMP family ABC transporter substrate-binding protein [Actinomycetota bacterium]